jgi:hypothetical protein
MKKEQQVDFKNEVKDLNSGQVNLQKDFDYYDVSSN